MQVYYAEGGTQNIFHKSIVVVNDCSDSIMVQ